MLEDVKAELAPNGVLRAGINLGNMLLVTGESPSGEPEGVSPDMARAIADRLGVGVTYVTYPGPGPTGDGVNADEWDICLIAAEPKRAEKIAFTAAYSEIESTYLVPGDSPIQSIAEVDRPGIRIAVSARAAYDLYLERTIQHAELVRAEGLQATFEMFAQGGFDALAGLRPALVRNAEQVPGARILDGQFMAVQQAIGTPKKNVAAAAFLRDFIEEAKASGFVASLIEKHGVVGRLSVAPAA